MRDMPIIEGTLIGSDEMLDPDLSQAFFDFEEEIRAEQDAQGTITVYEVPTDAEGIPRGKSYRRTRLFDVPIGSMTLPDICDKVLREYVAPGGRIMVQFLGHKAGQKGFKLNKMMPLRRPAGAAVAESSGSELARVLSIMQRENAQARADMLAMMERISKPAVDPMQFGMQLAEKLAGLASVMAGNRPQGAAPNNIMEQMMTMMLTKMMQKMMDGDTGTRAPPTSDDSGKILESIAGIAKPMLEAHAAREKTAALNAARAIQHQQNPPTPLAQAEQNTAAPEAPPAQTTNKETKEMKLIAVLREGLPQIVELGAKNNANPTDVARLVLDNIPENDSEVNDALYEMCAGPQKEFLGKLAVIDARVHEHAEWFERLRLAILAEFEPDRGSPEGGPAASAT